MLLRKFIGGFSPAGNLIPAEEFALGSGKFMLVPGSHPDHFVQFYEEDAFLVESVAAYIGAGPGAGEGAAQTI
jgi:hypothetical protein